MDEGLRLHLALCKVAERLAGVMEGARLERRDGYVLMTFPTLPIPSFNGVWPEDDSAAGALRDTITEIEATGIGAGVLARSGKMPAVEEAARVLGLTAAERIPGMVVNAGDLDRPATTELEVVRVETADGFAQALALAAEGFGLPADLLAPLYMLEVTGLDGFDVYLPCSFDPNRIDVLRPISPRRLDPCLRVGGLACQPRYDCECVMGDWLRQGQPSKSGACRRYAVCGFKGARKAGT